MIEQQLYIDGQLMDLSENTNITLDIKSNLFRDVTKMTTNNTYTIELPKTVHNMQVFNLPANMYIDNSSPFVFHTARYIRNGLEIISSGRASILSISDVIEISIYWGLFPNLIALQSSDKKLNELNINEYLRFNSVNKPYDYDKAMSEGIFYADYDVARDKGISDDWTNSDITIYTGNQITYYGLRPNYKIRTGEEVGKTISGEFIEDIYYQCIILPFTVGQTASIEGIISRGEYRMWAILDVNMNVITLANDIDEDNNKGQNVELMATSNAAYLVINTIEEFTSENARLKIEMKTQGTRTGNSTVEDTDKRGPIQPSVSCRYLLDRISAETNVYFDWGTEAEESINSLAIPLIKRNADANTLGEGVKGQFIFFEEIPIGPISVTLTEGNDIFNEVGYQTDKLTAKVACSMVFDMKMFWSWSPKDIKPSITYYNSNRREEKVYVVTPVYLEMQIKTTKDEEESTNEYIVGYPVTDENHVTFIYDYESNLVDGNFIHLITGHGAIELNAGDIITFKIKQAVYSPIFKYLRCYSGTIQANIQQSSEVPFGGNFPIGKNLPEVKIIDFIKFLSVINGLFPLQNSYNGKLKFASIEGMLNKSKAIDWSKKLIPNNEYNHPRQINFSIDDFAQHNIYKWKEDDTVMNDHDADFLVNNQTLEYTQDKYTMPFAASDNNRIPIYDWESKITYVGNGGNRRGITHYYANKYKACKDRIMNVYKNSDGKAALIFDIDLQNVFDNKLKTYRQTIAHPRQITERFILSDIDILEFDETVPVYVAQYACYFAILEIKTTENGYSEVTMIKIND